MRQFLPLHSPSLFDRAEEASIKEQGVISCILSAASIEAFINDLSDWYNAAIAHNKICNQKASNYPFQQSPHHTCIPPYFYHEFTDNEYFMSVLPNKLEESHASINLKLESIFEFLRIAINKGDSTHQNFSTLVKIRNDLIHIKGELLEQENPAEDNPSPIKGYPRYINNLDQLGIINLPKVLGKKSGLLEVLDNKKFAEWCIKAAYKMQLLIIEKLPSTPYTSEFKRDVSFSGGFIDHLIKTENKGQ